jgi:hypothetical protein
LLLNLTYERADSWGVWNGALGTDVASVMTVVAASDVVVDEGGLVLQLVEAGSRADGGRGGRVDEASTVALMEFGAEVILYAVSFLRRGSSLSSGVMGSAQRVWNLGSRGAPELPRRVFR